MSKPETPMAVPYSSGTRRPRLEAPPGACDCHMHIYDTAFAPSGFAELPTVAASGVPGFEVYEWNGLFAPKGTPAAVIERLEREVRAIVAQPDVRRKLADMGAEPVGSSSAEFSAFLRSETAKWSKVIKDANIKAD